MSAVPVRQRRAGTVVGDAITIFVRQALPSWREPFGLVFGMLQPLVFLVFFGPLLGGVADGPSAMGDGGPWMWFVPAVLVMLALFGTTGSGYMMLTEMQTGSHERLLVTPVDRTAMLVGRTLNDVATLLAQGVLIVLVMLPFGLRPHPVGVLLALVVLGIFGVAAGALSHALAIACRRQQEAFYMIQSSITFPLVFLSGLMLPLEMGPGWMQAVGRLNPVTHLAGALRALFAGDVGDPVVLRGVLAAVVLAVVGLVLGTRAMRASNT